MNELRSLSARAAASELNQKKVETPSGGEWYARTVTGSSPDRGLINRNCVNLR
jgi:hypothetical protein